MITKALLLTEKRRFWLSFFISTGWMLSLHAGEPPSISSSADGQLVRIVGPKGDQVPDFSYCGYEASSVALPNVAAVLIVEPSGVDDTYAIQSALEAVAHRTSETITSNSNEWRGAVLLAPGTFRISSTLYIRGNHLVLRGSRDLSGNLTEIRIVGKSRRPAIVVGTDSYDLSQKLPLHDSSRTGSVDAQIVDYVAVGATEIRLANVVGLKVGMWISILHPSTPSWIDAVGMRSFPDDDGKGSWLNWKANTIDQSWTRQVVSIEDNTIRLDAPITSSIDPNLTQGRVVSAQTPMHHHLGVEHLRLVSESDTKVNPLDEEHAWDGVRFNGVSDSWARDIEFRQFAGSAVQVGQDARKITVSDCQSKSPVSELAGWRRHTFFCLGQQSLFLRCTSEDGRHDFSTGPLTAGPNAFVYCNAKNASQYSGPIGSWSTGVLYDNVEVDGNSIQLTNRETEMAGSGWVAANCVLWNCVAPQIICRKPPTAFNLAVGIWGEVIGDGSWRSLNEFVSPDSLFAAHLAERMGKEHSEKILAKQGLANSNQSELETWSRQTQGDVESRSDSRMLKVTNGWLTIGDRLAIGKRQSLSWWRGSILPARATEFGAGLTRFVPGIDGTLFTNSVSDLVVQMRNRGATTLEHHWGLWYDRRRDDHQMIRRMNADVWPPFYEQPWARSGQGIAWDGLSKYDLTRFNHWYFDRLKQFAEVADQQGLIFMQHMYFQHNILEAGAHWADFPWRSANCIQDVGFDEPPVYENRKRIFMADAFYDVSHPIRRDLHTKYIRHCLDTLGQFNNVVFVLGEEYSGPAHFVRFWLDTVKQWMHEHDRDVMIMLSSCRDVQEEILSTTDYERLVDIVDIKYWWETKDGTLYDPPGGKSLAPRQQLRTWAGPKSRSIESTCKSIRDLKARFPEKAVVCSLPSESPWMLLAAGCSLTELPTSTDEGLLRGLVPLRPTNTQGWVLSSSSPVDGKSQKMIIDPNGVGTESEYSNPMRVNSKTGKLQSRSDDDSSFFSESNPRVMWIERSN